MILLNLVEEEVLGAKQNHLISLDWTESRYLLNLEMLSLILFCVCRNPKINSHKSI